MKTIRINAASLNLGTINYIADADCYHVATEHGTLVMPIAEMAQPHGLCPVIREILVNGEPVAVELVGHDHSLDDPSHSVGTIIASYRHVESR